MNNYERFMNRKNEIILKSVGVEYSKYETGVIAFDYEKLMKDIEYDFNDIKRIQREVGVGNTPLLELKNITALARKVSPRGKAARIVIKDESCNPSGSFKDRRAAISVFHAKERGFKGVASATSGNYGAAVASQAAMRGLECIIAQECYDSKKVGQPEILEKTRKCESLGAEVLRLTVGPELFYTFLKILEETGYYNASLYSIYGIAGVETLGYEIINQCRELFCKEPRAIVVTNAGGGNLTGTARGVIRAGGCQTEIIAASVDLKGLHMASDLDFNKKSFTTGHTGFGIPFAVNPDRSDVPRSAARPLRYMDKYVTIGQGQVFYMTELLAQLEGLERGPAGNTSLAAAFVLAQEMENEDILIVQETEYTGAGKHVLPQLSFARSNGIEIKIGDPKEEIPGKNIILPSEPSMMYVNDLDLWEIKKSYIRNAIKTVSLSSIKKEDIKFLMDEIKVEEEELKSIFLQLGL